MVSKCSRRQQHFYIEYTRHIGTAWKQNTESLVLPFSVLNVMQDWSSQFCCLDTFQIPMKGRQNIRTLDVGKIFKQSSYWVQKVHSLQECFPGFGVFWRFPWWKVSQCWAIPTLRSSMATAALWGPTFITVQLFGIVMAEWSCCEEHNFHFFSFGTFCFYISTLG